MKSATKDINEIVELCKQGDVEAKRVLYERFSARMFSLCCRYLDNKQDAEDALIDGFITVFEKINQLRTDNVEGWIYRIVANTCIAIIKDKNKLILKQDETVFENYTEVEIDNQERFSKQDLVSAMQALSTSQRTIFNMSVIDGYSHQEICQILGINYNSLKSMLYQTKIRLRDYLLNLEKQRGQGYENR
jgi:RNA polymerase sigma factor (sigma-70 family)